MKTKIEWTDYTWNPVWGCNGNCSYCYARNISKRFSKTIAEIEVESDKSLFDNTDKEKRYKVVKSNLFKFKPTFLISQFKKELPKKSKKIFLGSMTDIAFWEKDWIKLVIEKIKEYPQHIFQILTKYPELINDIKFPDNVWLGISAENQVQFERRTSELVRIKSGMKFVSLEPLLDKIDIDTYLLKAKDGSYPFKIQEKYRTKFSHLLDWVIVGGQTGHKAKAMQEDWVINILNKCNKYNIPFFFKSWGTGGDLRGNAIKTRKIFQNFPDYKGDT